MNERGQGGHRWLALFALSLTGYLGDPAQREGVLPGLWKERATHSVWPKGK